MEQEMYYCPGVEQEKLILELSKECYEDETNEVLYYYKAYTILDGLDNFEVFQKHCEVFCKLNLDINYKDQKENWEEWIDYLKQEYGAKGIVKGSDEMGYLVQNESNKYLDAVEGILNCSWLLDHRNINKKV